MNRTTLLLILILLLMLPFWLFSYTHHTTFGIDQETVQGDRVQFHYYRLWWPGNGTVFLGHGISQQTYQTERQYKNFDLAATLFQTPYNVPIPRSIWNHLGLWWVNKPAPINQWWIGLPSFSPVLIVLLFIYYLRCT